MSRAVRGGWVLEKTIGTGGFGAVTLWKNEELNFCIALKRCRVSSEMTAKHKDRWKKEIDIMLRLKHPNVVNAIQVPDELVDAHDTLPYLGMEYCSGGDLRKVLNKPENCTGLPEYQVRALVQDVASGIEYLHHTRIIHRDLKPENIVLQIVDENTVYKIIDLGYAKDLEQGSVCTSFVGTLQYLAPELFSSQRYTCTVDYWSFGILVFEAITGFRPFLPNINPLNWHQEVCKKDDDHIYVYYDRRGETKYSKSIPNPNYLCRTSKMYFEQWLRQMLVWDPRKRGGGLAETVSHNGPAQKRPKCFTLLDNILEMKILFILCVATGEVLSYAVKEGSSLANLQVVIEQETKIPVDEQELLLASGISPDPEKPAEQCWAEMGEEEWLVFLFRKNMTTYPAQARKLRAQPDLVQLMLKEPATLLTYQDQRSVWGHAVYFCTEVAKDYRRLLQGQRAAMMSLLRGNSNFSKLKTKLDTDFYRLQAQAEFFKDGLTYDITKYQDQTATGISSQKLTSKWKKMEEESAKFLSMKDEVLSLDQQCNVLSTRVVELQRSPFAKMKRIDVLEDVEKSARTEYDRLRQTPKEQRHLVSDNTPMVQLVKRCTRDRERLTSELYLHLGKISQCKQELDGLNPKLDKLVEEIEAAKERLRLLQRQRQGDMWTLLKMTLKQTSMTLSTQSSSQPSSILSTQTGASSDSGATTGGGAAGQASGTLTNGVGQPTALSSIINRSTEESVAVVSENQDIKNKLLDLMGSLQDEHSKSMNELQSLDWSFMQDPSQMPKEMPLFMPPNPLYPSSMYQPFTTAPQQQQPMSLPHHQQFTLSAAAQQQQGGAAHLQMYQPQQVYQQQQQGYQQPPQQRDLQIQYTLPPSLQRTGVSPGSTTQQQGAGLPAGLASSAASSSSPSVSAGSAAALQGSPSRSVYAQGSPRHRQQAGTKAGEQLTAEQQAAWLQQQQRAVAARSYTHILGQTLSGSRSASPSPPLTAQTAPSSSHAAASRTSPLLAQSGGGQLAATTQQPAQALYSSAQGLLGTQAYLTQIANGRSGISAVGAAGTGYTQLATQTPQISISTPGTVKRTPPKIPPRSTSATGSSG